MIQGRKLTVVLGGGGMKGLAHVGVLKVLHRYGIAPDEYVGTSVGAYIGALAAGGLTAREIEEIALAIRTRDILDRNWLQFLWRWTRARSFYRGKALHDFIRRTLPVDRFDRLLAPLYITSVDLGSSREVVWGMPGFTDLPIHDCVVAACSIPGLFPPKKINEYYFVDGSLVDTLPVKVAVYTKADIILAVYLEPREAGASTAGRQGITAIIQQSQSILSRTLARHNLHYFEKSPIVLIQPHVGEYGMFECDRPEEAIRAGEVAAEQTLIDHPLTRPLLLGLDPRAVPVPPSGEPTPPAFPAGGAVL
jgi:NTE family protein